MSKNRDLAFLRLLCSSGIDLMTLMPVASEVLKRLIPSFSLSMIRVDEEYCPQEHYSEYFDEFSHQLFASSGHAFSLRTTDPAGFRNLLTNKQAFGTLIDTSPDYLNGATYQYLFQRNGIYHVLDLALRDGTKPLGILGIFREQKAPAFNRKDLTVVEQLYPHLVHALSANVAPASFDEIDSAMLIVNQQGGIQWASESAMLWLAEGIGRDDRAALLQHQVFPKACQFLCKIWMENQKLERKHAIQPPVVNLNVPGGRLRLRAYGLSGQLEQQMPYIGIQLSLETHRGLSILQALHHMDLSPQLTRLAFLLWQGKGGADIGREMGISANTLKSYQRDLYQHLQVNNLKAFISAIEQQASSMTIDLSRHKPSYRFEKAI